jgi:hypothetical protein
VFNNPRRLLQVNPEHVSTPECPNYLDSNAYLEPYMCVCECRERPHGALCMHALHMCPDTPSKYAASSTNSSQRSCGHGQRCAGRLYEDDRGKFISQLTHGAEPRFVFSRLCAFRGWRGAIYETLTCVV